MSKDIIYREDAIWWVKTECNPYGKPTLDFESGKKVIEHLEHMPSADRPQEWIPCSERLPKKEEATYLICFETGGMCSCRWTNNMYGLGSNEWSKWGWHIMDKPQYAKVVAWMPLKPWKGEDDGEDIHSEAEQ